MRRDYCWLKESLDGIFRFLDQVYNINSGGCCYVAYLLARKLESLGIRYKLVLYDDEYTNSRTRKTPIKESIKNKDLSSFPNGSQTCCHYTLYVYGVGMVNAEDYDDMRPLELCGINSDDILWIYKTGSWNKCYNTTLNTIIESYINLIFESYDKYFKNQGNQED